MSNLIQKSLGKKSNCFLHHILLNKPQIIPFSDISKFLLKKYDI